MHPMERLRSVARSEGATSTVLVHDAARALAGLGPDAAGLVVACRRLLERHPAVGPLWWLAARVLCAADPVAEARAVAGAVEDDPTPAALAAALPADATVVLVGWAELAAEALGMRGDVAALVVSSAGDAHGLAVRLDAHGVAAADVDDAMVATAVAEADLVVLEATAVGPGWLVAAPGSLAAAAAGHAAGVAVWVVAGTGRVVPGPVGDALAARLGDRPGEAWEKPWELVPLALCERVVGPGGPVPAAEVSASTDHPVAPELLRP